MHFAAGLWQWTIGSGGEEAVPAVAHRQQQQHGRRYVPSATPYGGGDASASSDRFGGTGSDYVQPMPTTTAASLASAAHAGPSCSSSSSASSVVVEAVPADIQRLAAAHGFTHNVKIVIRGASRSGKTSLLHRLQGKPIPPTHLPTTAIQAVTVRWASSSGSSSTPSSLQGYGCGIQRATTTTNGGAGGGGPPPPGATPTPRTAATPAPAAVSVTKMDAWDVVDHGVAQPVGRTAAANSGDAVALLREAPKLLPRLPIDATTVDVYRDCRCLILLVDVTRWDTYTYAAATLKALPPNHSMCVAIVANFMDLVEPSTTTSSSSLASSPSTPNVPLAPAAATATVPLLRRLVSDADLEELTTLVRPAITPFMSSVVEGRGLDGFECPARVIHASLRTGAGLRALHQFLACPVAMAQAAALEYRLSAAYAEMRKALDGVQRMDQATQQQAATAVAAARRSRRGTAKMERRRKQGNGNQLRRSESDGSTTASSSSDAEEEDEAQMVVPAEQRHQQPLGLIVEETTTAASYDRVAKEQAGFDTVAAEGAYTVPSKDLRHPDAGTTAAPERQRTAAANGGAATVAVMADYKKKTGGGEAGVDNNPRLPSPQHGALDSFFFDGDESAAAAGPDDTAEGEGDVGGATDDASPGGLRKLRHVRRQEAAVVDGQSESNVGLATTTTTTANKDKQEEAKHNPNQPTNSPPSLSRGKLQGAPHPMGPLPSVPSLCDV